MKVLYHVDQRDKWELTLGNVINMLAYGRENNAEFEIEVVANGPAVADLKETEARKNGLHERLSQIGTETAVCACNNALRGQGILPEELLSFVKVVPAGVVEIAGKQQEGFAYIKP
ncbi:DsrE family protein [Anaerolentibacter hominis]|uniref:DsrE family protein n=1 Tax=Anaerolentibacter hominis TaxID=3079009 RepID=UPI0031B83952